MKIDRLDAAIVAFEDEQSELTLGERISILREALMINAFEVLKRVKKYGQSSPLSDDEMYKQEQCAKQFKQIEAMYNSQLRQNKLTGKSNDKVGKEFMDAIREMKSSVGEIVRKTGNE